MTGKKSYATVRTLPRKTRAWMEVLEEAGGYQRDRLGSLPGTTALLVIDMQKYFLRDNVHAFIPAGLAIIPNVARLQMAFRERGMPVIFTRHGHRKRRNHGQMGRWWGDILMASDPLADIVPEIAPKKGETVVRKRHYDAFKDTELLFKLHENKVTHLVITGVMTHLCCETTARSAFMNDFEVAMTVDGTATSDIDYHLATLEAAAHGFAVPFTTREIIERLPDPEGGEGH
jgi:isochorismate hydrolase